MQPGVKRALRAATPGLSTTMASARETGGSAPAPNAAARVAGSNRYFNPSQGFARKASLSTLGYICLRLLRRVNTINQPKMKFDVDVSRRCAMRTSAGMSGFGNNNGAVMNTPNSSATANPACHQSPFIIFMTGTASAVHNSARTA